jgi:hypothetical protein
MKKNPCRFYWEVALKILTIPVPGLKFNPAVQGPAQSIPFAMRLVWANRPERSEAQPLEPVLIFWALILRSVATGTITPPLFLMYGMMYYIFLPIAG